MNRYDLIGGICFLLMLGIAGGVENGAPLRNMIAAVPLLAIFAACVTLADRRRT